MSTALLNYYQAIEKASQDMLEAARVGNWDHVVKLEGACALLILELLLGSKIRLFFGDFRACYCAGSAIVHGAERR